jgi:hypothetical protein
MKKVKLLLLSMFLLTFISCTKEETSNLRQNKVTVCIDTLMLNHVGNFSISQGYFNNFELNRIDFHTVNFEAFDYEYPLKFEIVLKDTFTFNYTHRIIWYWYNPKSEIISLKRLIQNSSKSLRVINNSGNQVYLNRITWINYDFNNVIQISAHVIEPFNELLLQYNDQTIYNFNLSYYTGQQPFIYKNVTLLNCEHNFIELY